MQRYRARAVINTACLSRLCDEYTAFVVLCVVAGLKTSYAENVCVSRRTVNGDGNYSRRDQSHHTHLRVLMIVVRFFRICFLSNRLVLSIALLLNWLLTTLYRNEACRLYILNQRWDMNSCYSSSRMHAAPSPATGRVLL